jgi:hypothetical protein
MRAVRMRRARRTGQYLRVSIEQTIGVGTRFTRWFDHAACRDGSLEEFFEHRVVGGRPSHHAYAAARRYCARCPVLSSCRREADRHGDVGLWGGQWRDAGDRTGPIDLLPDDAPSARARRRRRR